MKFVIFLQRLPVEIHLFFAASENICDFDECGGYLQWLTDKIYNLFQQPVGKICDYLPQAIDKICSYINKFHDTFQQPIEEISGFLLQLIEKKKITNFLPQISVFFTLLPYYRILPYISGETPEMLSTMVLVVP